MFLKHLDLPLTYRETRSHLTQRVTILALIGSALLLGLSGPFGTFEVMSAVPRIGYWAIIVFSCYACGTFLIRMLSSAFPNHWPHWAIDGVAGAVAGLAITVLITLINSATFPDLGHPVDVAVFLLPYCVLITFFLSVLIGQISEQTLADPKNTDRIPLLDRLPFEKRGELISIQAQDHYVRVTTSKGQELVLLRFSDALNEISTVAGFQTHRSYWVAQSQISAAKRQGERGVLTLQNGDELPVSRNFMPKLKTAGFF